MRARTFQINQAVSTIWGTIRASSRAGMIDSAERLGGTLTRHPPVPSAVWRRSESRKASPVEPAKAAPVDSTALYKIVPVESESIPANCPNCPPQKTNTPTFTLQGDAENPSGFASKIDTFRTSVWNPNSNSNEAIEGYCSISFTNLKCLGDNRYGQLGDESIVNSLTVPVEAKDKGIVINGVTDVSSNGLTTCIVASGALKCVGQGDWDGTYFKSYYTIDTTST